MSTVAFSYVERNKTLTVTGEYGITISIYSANTIEAAKRFLGIEDATDFTKEKRISEKLWDKFLKMEY